MRFYHSADSTISSSDTLVDTVSVVPLGAPGGYVGNIEPTAPSTAGTYYYGVCVDSVTGESDTTNNCSAAVAVTVVAPDLAVDTPTVSDNTPVVGASFTLEVTVRNQDSGSSAVTTLRYYQSTDSRITTGDTEVGTDEVYRLIGPADTYQSISLTAPSPAGTYYYGACVDAVAGESDTTNNCSSSITVTVGAAPTPDLVVDTPTVSESAPAAGTSFTVSVTVRNEGGGNSSSTTLRYYRSNDSTISSSDTSVGTDSVSGLTAASTSTQSISLTAPSTAGTYYYGACVDAVSDESNTTNNCSASVQVIVAAPAASPDLAIRSVGGWDGIVDTGSGDSLTEFVDIAFSLNAQVHNIGDGPSSATTLRYYRSADSTITVSDTEIGTDAVIALRGNILDILDMNPTAPDTPGTYYYGVCVDSVSNESNTTNNCSTAVQVTVIAPPDLIVETPEVWYSSVTLVLGQSFRGTVIVRNQGGTLPSNRYYVTKAHHFLSTDSTITTSDALLGTKNPSSSGEGRTSWMYLPAPAAGTYYYGVCVDPVSHESDTTNNCSDSVEVTVHAVDLVVENLTVSDSTLTAGERFRLSFDVRNQGDHIHYGPTTLRYYRSNDAEFDSDDVEVAVQTSTDGIPRAGRGFTSDRIIAHRPFVPNTDGRFSYPYITDGTFYYIVCVDPVSDESDTANNCSSGWPLRRPD